MPVLHELPSTLYAGTLHSGVLQAPYEKGTQKKAFLKKRPVETDIDFHEHHL